jgi:peptide/nickel transport system ATP-binding protein
MTAPTTSLDTAGDPIISVRDLKVVFDLPGGTRIEAVRGASLTMERGRTLAIVGESGCGKSVTARAMLQLLDRPGRIAGGRIDYYREPGAEPIDLAPLAAKGAAIRRYRGREMAMIFQEPMASMSPVHTIGDQIGEAMIHHFALTKAEARARVLDLIAKVGLPNPVRVADSYPFQMSGGMLQRAMIALALGCGPKVLVADEPTTALDVTTQAQILDLIAGLQRETGMSILFITHDLGVVAEIADRVAVMYLGEVVETGTVHELFDDPQHPYTQALMASVLRIDRPRDPSRPLEAIRGMVPLPTTQLKGCPFAPRCREAVRGLCTDRAPPRVDLGPGRSVLCTRRMAEGVAA